MDEELSLVVCRVDASAYLTVRIIAGSERNHNAYSW